MTPETGQMEVKLYTCLRCGHKWANRKPRIPKICPRCKSYDFDLPKSK